MHSLFAVCLRRSLVVLSLWVSLLSSAYATPSSQWTAAFTGHSLASSHLISVVATTAFPNEVAASGSTLAQYTVTNISTIPLTGISTQLAAPNAFSIQSTTCGASSPLGVGDTCTVTLSLQAPNADTTLSGTLNEGALPSLDAVYADVGPVHVNAPLTLTSSAGTNGSVSPGSVTVAYGGSQVFTATPNNGYSVNAWLVDGVVVQTGGTSYTLSNVTANHTVSVSFYVPLLMVAVGNELNSSAPVIQQSVDNGLSWQSKSISGGPSQGTLYSVSCTGTGSDAVCAAGGKNSDTAKPLLVVSRDNGGTWNPATLDVFDDTTQFNTTSCTGSGVSAFCLAAGSLPIGSETFSVPVLVKSSDGGLSWTTQTVPSSPREGTFTASSCTGSGSNLVCTVIGDDSAELTPVLVVGAGDPTVWRVVADISALTNVRLNTTSCTGSGITAVCVAAGYDISSTDAPLIVLSTDGGLTWSRQSISGLATSGRFYGSSCTGSGASVICSVVGWNGEVGKSLVAMLNTSSGVVWTVPTLPGGFEVTLKTTSCTGSGSSALCMAAGQNADGVGELIQTTNGGSSWASSTITGGMPDSPSFRGSHCSLSNPALCTVVGDALVQTTNGGTVWTKPVYDLSVLYASSGT